MDCETARVMLTFFGRRGEELAADDRVELDAHGHGCAGCAARFAAEQAFDNQIAGAMRAVPIPAGLRAKIDDSLDADRGDWFRRRLVAGGMATAALFLGFAGYVAYQIQTAAPLRADALMALQDQSPKEQVARELARHGMSYNPQRPFDLDQLASAGDAELQGRRVPMLYLRNVRKNSQARVYVVNDRMLNWKALDPDHTEFQSKLGYQVAVMPDAVRGDVGYVIVYTGESLDAFLESSSSP